MKPSGTDYNSPSVRLVFSGGLTESDPQGWVARQDPPSLGKLGHCLAAIEFVEDIREPLEGGDLAQEFGTSPVVLASTLVAAEHPGTTPPSPLARVVASRTHAGLS